MSGNNSSVTLNDNWTFLYKCSEYIIDLMGAPGTLIPTEVPSAHHHNLELDAMTIDNTPGGQQTCCMMSDQGAQNRPVSPCMDGGPKPSTSSAGSSLVSVHSNVRGKGTAGIILTEQLEHNVADLYLPPGGNSSEDQCHAIQLSENEHSLIPFSGQQLSNMSCDSSRKHSAEGLRANMFELDSAGHKLSPTNPWEQNVHVDDRNDEASSIIEAGFGRDIDASGNNVQINSMLNGVAEILWEDLQIGERIGIGTNFGGVFPFSL